MTSSSPELPSDSGFATAAAMAISLALALGSSAVLIRSALDLKIARNEFERTRAAYALDAVQTLAAYDLLNDKDQLKLRRIAFGELAANVHAEDEASKLRPADAARLPEAWLQGLGVKNPSGLKATLAGHPPGPFWSLAALADLDPSPLWKACAAAAISESGAAKGKAMTGQLAETSLPRTVRLTAEGEAGWVEDRIVRLTSDPANPVLVLDRRMFRRTVEAPACPRAPAREPGV